MTLRPVAPLNFPDLVRDDAPGDEPRLAVVAPTELLVDETYQRDLTPRSIQLIRRIVAGWRWRAFKPPIVVSTDEGLHVIDGQHTAIAAASHPHVHAIPVLIVGAEDALSRADSFVRHNRDKLPISGVQLHHALVRAGDEIALTVERVCARAGARLVRTMPRNGVWRAGDTVAVEALRALVDRRHAQGARKVLQVCVEGRMTPVTAMGLRAVEHALFTLQAGGPIDPDDLATAIRALGTRAEAEAALHAATHRTTKWRGLAAVLIHTARKGGGHGHRAAA